MTLPLADKGTPDQPQSVAVEVSRLESATGVRTTHEDFVSIEEPLEIILNFGDVQQTISITMRTPGHDFELVLGFLYAEGVIRSNADVVEIDYWGPRVGAQNLYNTVIVKLAHQPDADLKRLERNYFTHAGCGICGKTALEALTLASTPQLTDQVTISAELLHGLTDKMSLYQDQYSKTGGIHAAALFDTAGEMVALFEDVGRHNAMDKLIGSLLLNNHLPASAAVVAVSGRASFELVQKALMANIPIFAAVGAPSSLALELAVEHDMTLVGFLKSDRLNVYHAEKRIDSSQ